MLEPGLEATFEETVTEQMTAEALGSGARVACGVLVKAPGR